MFPPITKTPSAEPENKSLEALALEWFVRRQQGQEVTLLELCQGDQELATALAAKLQRLQQDTAHAIASAGAAAAVGHSSLATAEQTHPTDVVSPAALAAELTLEKQEPITDQMATLIQPGSTVAPVTPDKVGQTPPRPVTLQPQSLDTATAPCEFPAAEHQGAGRFANGVASLLLESGLVSEADLERAATAPTNQVALQELLLQAGATRLPPLRPADQTLLTNLIQLELLTPAQLLMLFEHRLPKLVLGNYEILEPIGAGGMGQVFKARHRRMKREVALKVLPANAMITPAAVERFRREVEAAAKLSHPNIVTAFDADEAEGLHFLVMEYVAGLDLHRWIDRKGTMTVPQAINVLVQVARALEYAHKMGIVHRDIKPSNLLVTSTGLIKMLDLGLVRQAPTSGGKKAETLTESGVFMGTVDYMAPEQAADASKADHRADLYSLGCTLFYLLIGKPVVEGDTVVERLVAHRINETPNLCELRPDVPEALNAVFQRLLQKEPSNRYQSATDLLHEIRDTGLLTLAKHGTSGNNNPQLNKPNPQRPITAVPVEMKPTPGPTVAPHLRKSATAKTGSQPSLGQVHSEPPPLPNKSTHPKESPEAQFVESVKNFHRETTTSGPESFYPPAVVPAKAGLPTNKHQQPPRTKRRPERRPRSRGIQPATVVIGGLVLMLTLMTGIYAVQHLSKLVFPVRTTITLVNGDPKLLRQVKLELHIQEPHSEKIPVEWRENQPITVPRARGTLEILRNGSPIWCHPFDTIVTDHVSVDVTGLYYAFHQNHDTQEPEHHDHESHEHEHQKHHDHEAHEHDHQKLHEHDKHEPGAVGSNESGHDPQYPVEEQQQPPESATEPGATAAEPTDFVKWDEIWLHLGHKIKRNDLHFEVTYIHPEMVPGQSLRWEYGKPLQVTRGSVGYLEIQYRGGPKEKVDFDFRGGKKYLKCSIMFDPDKHSKLYIELELTDPAHLKD